MARRDVRKTILEYSMQYLEKHGCKFSVDDMMKELNMSKRTFYRYFETKELLLIALIDTLTEEVQETMKLYAANETLSVEEKLYRVLTIETNFEKLISYRHIAELEKYYSQVYQYLMSRYEYDWCVVEELLSQGMETGIYKKQSVDLIKTLLQNGMQMLCRGDFLERNGLTYQEALHQTVEIILRGIRR